MNLLPTLPQVFFQLEDNHWGAALRPIVIHSSPVLWQRPELDTVVVLGAWGGVAPML